MKKFSTVLLIAVLAVSTVFADSSFSGSATAALSYDFDTNVWGYADGTEAKADWSYSYDFKQSASMEGGNSGEKTPYAVIAGTAEVKATEADNVKIATYAKNGYTLNQQVIDLASVTFKISAKITKAEIIGENWKLDFLGGTWAQDWAKSAIDFVNRKVSGKTYTGYYNNDLSDWLALDAANTLLFEYDGYKITLGLADDNYKFEQVQAGAALETKTFEFDGGTASAFASFGFFTDGTDTSFGGEASAKADYTADDLAVAVAADLGWASVVDMEADAALKASYDFLTFDAYYATNAHVDVKNGSTLLFSEDIEDLASAKLAANLEEYKTTLTIEALDIIHKQDFSVDVTSEYFENHILNAGAENVLALNEGAALKEDGLVNTADARRIYASAVVTAVEDLKVTVGSDDILGKDLYAEAQCTMVENLDLTVGGKDILGDVELYLDAIYSGIENHSLELKADYVIAANTLEVEYIGGYTGDLLDATLRAKFNTDFAGNDTLGVYAIAESEAIVDGATLGLEYGAYNKNTEVYAAQWLGTPVWSSITAYCTMSF